MGNCILIKSSATKCLNTEESSKAFLCNTQCVLHVNVIILKSLYGFMALFSINFLCLFGFLPLDLFILLKFFMGFLKLGDNQEIDV